MNEAKPVKDDADTPRIPISLVLGSGGARGYAHIGVIDELIAQGFDIQSIAGSSMGALIGGVYAAGKLEAYRDWVLPLAKFDVFKLLDITISGGGFIKGDRIISALREHVGEVAIEDLPIRYTAVAVDLDAHREVWFSQGSLFDAIRASIAIPTVFRPHRYQGRLLVDGGLLNPLPVSPTLRDFTAATIAVDVNGPAEPLDAFSYGKTGSGIHADGEPPIQGGREGGENKTGNRMTQLLGSWFGSDKPLNETPDPSIIELFASTLDTVQETITRLKLAAQPPDLLITIPRNTSTFYEFHRAEGLIEIGRQRTREALARWSPTPHVRR